MPPNPLTARLGIGPPEGWAWEYLRQHVVAHGSFRLDHLERRHVPRAAELATAHGLSLWVTPTCAALRLAGDPAR